MGAAGDRPAVGAKRLENRANAIYSKMGSIYTQMLPKALAAAPPRPQQRGRAPSALARLTRRGKVAPISIPSSARVPETLGTPPRGPWPNVPLLNDFI